MLLSFALLLAGCEEEHVPPDVVLVVVDTLRADRLGTYGYARPTSPAIDALAKDSLVFDRAYANAPWTLPSFASMLTGLLPHDHKVGRDPVRVTSYGRLEGDLETLAELAKSKGYRTAAFVNNSYLAREFGFQQGFDVYDWVGASNDVYRSDGDTVEQALAWLTTGDAESPRAPAFLLLHFMEPHLDYGVNEKLRGTFAPTTNPPVPVPFGPESIWAPWMTGAVTPPPEVQTFVKALYDEDLLDADQGVGALLDRIGDRPNTIVALTSDHGEEHWDHGGFEHGHTLHSELLRVPLIVHGPDIEPQRVATPVSHVDLFQGLVHRIGITSVPGTSGDDLFAIAAAAPPDRPIVSENIAYGPPQIALTTKDARVLYFPIPRPGRAEVWRIAPDGSDLVPFQDAEAKKLGPPLLQTLEAIRGGLDLPRIRGTRIDSRDVFEQLKALGYVDDDVHTLPSGASEGLLDPSKANARAPATFEVELATTEGTIVVRVVRAWAPLAADRFYNLARIGFLDGLGFYRVVKGFVAQTGISPNPTVSARWLTQRLPDEPRKRSNTRGTIVFAAGGPNTRSTEFFFNLADNPKLDGQGFVPFGEVVSGKDVLDRLSSRYGEAAGPMGGTGPDPAILFEEGNRYLQNIFPGLSFIVSAKIR
jgi:arylsulfatase A-like enzyme/cyclophilin family peptidyl-prolyl cis-trans isomerase